MLFFKVIIESLRFQWRPSMVTEVRIALARIENSVLY